MTEHGFWMLRIKTSYNRTISEVAKNYKPRKLPDVGRPKMWLSGVEFLLWMMMCTIVWVCRF